MLRSFVIDGFRTFGHLPLTGLGAVNLVTGRNNVGKTMVLEALRLHGAEGDARVVEEQLRAREEFDAQREPNRLGHSPSVDVSALFHGRPTLNGTPLSLSLGPLEGEGGRLRLRAGVARWSRDAQEPSFLTSVAGVPREELAVGLGVQWNEEPEKVSRVPDRRPSLSTPDGEIFFGPLFPQRKASDKPPFVSARGLSRELAARWWDSISLTDAEDRVIECLRIVAPVEKIALVRSGDAPDGRSFVFKLSGEGDRIPMHSLGDGVGRMFWMALALEIARAGGLLLIDELENGIHYSVLPDLWRFILRAAAAQGVQVFATTHSWDCIEAFQTAVSESASDGALIRLTRRGDAVEPTVFNREELAVATRGEIELR